MSWLWPDGDALEDVQTDALGSPLSFRWRGKTYRVDEIWRDFTWDDEWWIRRQWRDYFKITTADSGILLLIFKDLETGNWFALRLYG